MIRALIFDLDNCLAPADEVGHALYEPAFAAMRSANHGILPEETLRAAFTDCWWHPLDWIARRYAFPPGMFEAGWRVFTTLENHRPLHGYGDLSLLPSLGCPLFLVTSGFLRLQQSKIASLGITPYFTEIHIDAIDDPSHPGKLHFFRHILAALSLPPGEALVIGDSPHSELAAARSLGIPAVQILRPGVTPSADIPRHIHSLADLIPLLASHS